MAFQQHALLRFVLLVLVFTFPTVTSAQSLDTSCNFTLIPDVASELIRRISKFPTDGYDVKSNVDVVSFSHQPIPLYSQYISLDQNGEVDRVPPFVHYADVTVEQAVDSYCSTIGKAFKNDCISSLTEAHTKDRDFRKQSSKAISRSLEAFKNNRLPASIDFADVAADVGDIQLCSSGIERSDYRKALKVELNNQALPPLRNLAIDTGADLEAHGYDILLSDMYDNKKRLESLRVLEIGLGGSAGLHTWRRFFPAARLHVMEVLLPKDCHPCHIAGGVLGWGGNSADVEFLESFVNRVGGAFDLIIDDGGHLPSDQLSTWAYLFKRALKPDGNYVVVDIETSYWSRPGASLYGKPVHAGKGSEESVIEAFKSLADGVNREFFNQNWSDSHRLDVCAAREVEHVTFAHNAVVLKKRGSEVREHHHRIYPSHNVVEGYKLPQDFNDLGC